MARILLIEDSPTVTMILTKALQDEGHKTITASDGLAALELLHHPPDVDLIMVDLFMPVVGGRTVVEAIRRHPKLQQTPIMIVTGAVPSSHDYPPEGSYQAIIRKPFDVGETIAKVHELLRHRSA